MAESDTRSERYNEMRKLLAPQKPHWIHGNEILRDLIKRGYGDVLLDLIYAETPVSERGDSEYICKCCIRVVPHRCQIAEEF